MFTNMYTPVLSKHTLSLFDLCLFYRKGSIYLFVWYHGDMVLYGNEVVRITAEKKSNRFYR